MNLSVYEQGIIPQGENSMSKAVSNRPPEVTADIGKAVEEVNTLSPSELLEEYNTRVNEDERVENARPAWLKKKIKYLRQEEILAAAGLDESATIAENHAKVDAQDGDDGTKDKKKAGRPRLNTLGPFVLALGENDSGMGRAGSVKNGIMERLHAMNCPFTYEEFKAAVSTVLQWNEGTEAFGHPTKFETLDKASGAWFSELRNKAKVIVSENPAITEAPQTEEGTTV